MPRKYVPFDSEAPYHLTGRSNNRDEFPLEPDETWDIFSRYLYFVVRAYNIKVRSFVLMPNHFHLLAQFPDGGMGESMNYFMRECSREIGRRAGTINHNFGNRYFRSRIGSEHYFRHAYKYVYRNPVEAGLVERPDQYPYSTLNGVIGESWLSVPMEEDLFLFGDPGIEKTLTWLNQSPTIENRESVRLALKREEFGFSKQRGTGKPHPLEFEWY